MTKDGTLLALGSVAALAVAATLRRRGSRTTISGGGHSISLSSEPDLLIGGDYFHATFDGMRGAGWSATEAVVDAVKRKARLPRIADDREGEAVEERIGAYGEAAAGLLADNGWMNWVNENDFYTRMEADE